MHDYSIDRSPKVKVLFALTLAAVVGAPIGNAYMRDLAGYLGLSPAGGGIALTSVSVFSLFSLLYWIFNRYCWKWRWLRHLLLVPDLNGTWTCAGKTTLKNGEPMDFDWNATVNITQSWSHILIHLKAKQSESKSTAASICHEAGVGYRLIYTYANSPDASNTELQKHAGLAEFVVDEDGERAEGSYFTDQHRLTVGTMKLRKVTDGH